MSKLFNVNRVIIFLCRMRVTCDDTHLHFINQHQFVDSPEWEANHEQSDDVFQVTITAEEDCTYLCWSRMKLERVLRHRPMLKTVLDAIIGKLYNLNLVPDFEFFLLRYR